MTQRRVRQIMDVWYGDGPLGYCGDEDYGEMASWYVLSAMGFYTVAPGRPVYDIGCPLFEKSTIDLGGGKTFTVKAPDVSAQNKYIQSATLNGRPRPPVVHTRRAAAGRNALPANGSAPQPQLGSKSRKDAVHGS